MANLTPTAVSLSSDFNSGVGHDETKDVLSDLLANRTETYSWLTAIRRQQYSASAPANPNIGDLWRCSTTAGLYVADTTYRWSGTAWVQDTAPAINTTARNVVIQGAVTTAGATALFTGSTAALTVQLNATATPMVVTWMDGNDGTSGKVDYVGAVAADSASFWNNLAQNAINYLYVDYDGTSTISGGFSTVAPTHQSYEPAHATGVHWIDDNTGKVFASNGLNAWTQVYRVFVGTATTDGTKVTAVTIYDYNRYIGDIVGSATLDIPLTYLDTDGTLAADSDSKIATQKAVKAYVDAGGGGVTGLGDYIVDGLTATASTAAATFIAVGQAVISDTLVSITATTTVNLAARYAQLVYLDNTGSFGTVNASFPAVGAQTVLRWVSTAWDGATNIASSVGSNDLVESGTVAQENGIIGYRCKGNASNGYLRAANNTNIPVYTAAVTVHYAFTFVNNAGVAQCFYDHGTVKIACGTTNYLLVGGIDTLFLLETGKHYVVSVTGAGNTMTGNVYVNGAFVFTGAVIANTAPVRPYILCTVTPNGYALSAWHGTMIDNVAATAAQIASIAQKMLIPCATGEGTTARTDIRSVIPTDSLVVGYTETSATVPTLIIDGSNPSGSTPDWAYGVRVGPRGCRNRRKNLGAKAFVNSQSYTWVNPFDSVPIHWIFYHATVDTTAKTMVSEMDNASFGVLPNKNVNPNNIKFSVGGSILLTVATAGFLTLIAEVYDEEAV